MASLTVLLRHSGKWNIKSNYVDYSIEGILKRSMRCIMIWLCQSLINNIDLTSKSIKIQYKVEENYTPMEIHNNMGYRVYVELKKENREFGMYPLCITTIEKELVSGGSLIQGDIVQIDESVQRYDSDTDDTLVLDFVNSRQAITVFELNKDLIISKTNQREVMAGQVYKDKAKLKEVMEHYAISQRFQFRVDRSNSVSYALLCMSEDCEWRFKASSINKSELFKVREFIDKHTCPLKDKVYEQRQASSSLIGGMIRPKLTNHKIKYTPKDIIDDVKSDLGVDVSYMLAWRAKEKAINFLRGEPADSYKKLPGYVDKLYVDIYALLCMSEDCEWRFKASSINKSELFKVRDFIDKHTCPLKDKVYEQRQASSSLIGGMIRPKLTNHKRKYTPKDIIDDVKSDLGVDVSYMLAWRAKEKAINFLRDHILPLAYGVIDSENDAAWTWFFEKFKIAYGDRENMCIVSDRNESIIKSVSRVYLDVPLFACIWHLWNNVYKKFKKSHAKLSKIYFSMAKAYTQAEFDSLIEKVENVDIKVKEYLELAGYEKWARLYSPVNRGWTMTSNIVESINVALVSARELPIYDFLEEVRKMFGR
ncbi:uncharacterized protein [Nicotiana sylvestris]|uniref:uncharacterized protein n=1 Tax=Nicotiana sylvestris TaxID=4096 RepID=UPI00388C6C9A